MGLQIVFLDHIDTKEDTGVHRTPRKIRSSVVHLESFWAGFGPGVTTHLSHQESVSVPKLLFAR